jgi:hypothetical protein
MGYKEWYLHKRSSEIVLLVSNANNWFLLNALPQLDKSPMVSLPHLRAGAPSARKEPIHDNGYFFLVDQAGGDKLHKCLHGLFHGEVGSFTREQLRQRITQHATGESLTQPLLGSVLQTLFVEILLSHRDKPLSHMIGSVRWVGFDRSSKGALSFGAGELPRKVRQLCCEGCPQ